MPYGEGQGWESETLTEESQVAWYKAALARHERAEADLDSIRNMALISLGGGVLIGLLGMGYALLADYRRPKAEPPAWILVHDTTGQVDKPISGTDAPKLFTDPVRKKALRDMLVACESYIPETWAVQDYHACMIFLTPAEQKRRADDIGRFGPRYPVTVFGPKGWAMPSRFNDFVPLGSVGAKGAEIWHYQVRYERYEVTNGNAARQHYTLDVTFSFHPELLADANDALNNPTGLQVSAFSTTKD